MNTTTSVAGTMAIVVAGKWANGEPVKLPIFIGGAVFAISLSLVASSQPKLAEQFGTLVLLAALFAYVPTIATKTGLAAKGAGK